MPENANTVNLKSASIVVIMLSHEGLTHIHSQIKPQMLFGESFTLKCANNILKCHHGNLEAYSFFCQGLLDKTQALKTLDLHKMDRCVENSCLCP